MDLRVKKTQKSIKGAFFRLRKKKPIDKISIKELSEQAEISKATFYLHYKDIYDLEERLENDLITDIVSELNDCVAEPGKTEAKLISEELSRSILSHKKEIDVLYSPDNSNRFINKLEDELRDFVFTRIPGFPKTPENEIVLSFVIQGSYFAHLRNISASPEMLKNATARVFAGVFG